MSELMNVRDVRGNFRWDLLTTVSMLALSISFWISDANAEDTAERPTVWIELGGQLESVNDAQEAVSPPFMRSITQANLLSALNVQRPPASTVDEDGKISFQPGDSDWVFSASIRYGRASANRHRHQQTANKTVPANFNFNPPLSNYHLGPKYYYPYLHAKFADGQARQSEAHNIIDFQAGKDVGLGMFGGGGSSVFSAGVRIAQITSKSNIRLRAEPDVHYPTTPLKSENAWFSWRSYHPHFHDYALTAATQRSFRGIGPSLTWNASAPFVGNSAHGEMLLDWGLNGAVLFGRQKAVGQHKTAVHYYHMTGGWQTGDAAGAGLGANGHQLRPGRFLNNILQTCHGEQIDTAGIGPNHCTTSTAGFNRGRTVTVPNLGGTIGLSYRIQNFKISAGYRADLFFGAVDGGIDVAKKENVGFYGPFASVSVGLGG